MEYTRLGSSGLKVSRIALGCMSFGTPRPQTPWTLDEQAAWVLKNPVVSAPIVGATKPHHLTDAAAALDLALTDEDIRALEDPYTPREPTYF